MPGDINILIIALNLDWMEANRSATFDRAKATVLIKEAMTKLEAVQGLTVETLFLDPEDSNVLTTLEQKIKPGKPYDGVLTGYGLRGDIKLTPLFEQVINTVREASPSTRLLFSTLSDNPLDVIRRNFSSL